MAYREPDGSQGGKAPSLNVLGGPLAECGRDPMTGFWREGCCNTGREDAGVHTVCAIMTADFLAFSKSVGNDLSTPHPEFGFAGLQPGDRWCLCAARWAQAHQAGAAPRVVLAATHIATLHFTTLDDLKAYASDLN